MGTPTPSRAAAPAPSAGHVTLLSAVDVVEETPVDRFLAEQADLSAVEGFSQRHDAATTHQQERSYRDLMPASAPAPGQQLAFAVDLDACTGCKACVAACHSLNGLEEHETWSDVGLLVGERTARPHRHPVPPARHHCADPAWLDGCPVMAYEKDVDT